MSLESMRLWQRTLSDQENPYQAARARLRVSLDSMRDRVSHLVATISNDLPSLTVHDITHLDALWRVADVIAGPTYPINPAEAYVLGGSFLLHDSAHAIAAYPNGISDLKKTTHWKDLISQKYSSVDPPPGSNEEKAALFQVLRHLHAEQAHRLVSVVWQTPDGNSSMRLIEDEELHQFYGDLIGEIASSHHWTTHRVTEIFSDRIVSPPAFLDAEWTVDALKIAFLLRTADAAHLDALRAPWFLFALKKPLGISRDHWKFQSKLGQPTLNHSGELVLTCGSPFYANERQAWWLAYDAARVVDRELRDAFAFLRDSRREVFAAKNVYAIHTPESFARQVRVNGWEPINVEPIVSNIPRIISTLGGSALYGDDKSIPLRELIQNGADAVRAARKLGQIDLNDGDIEVSITKDDADSG